MYNQIRIEIYKCGKSMFFIFGFLVASVMLAVVNIFVHGRDISGQQAMLGSLSDTSLLFIMALFVSYFIGGDFTNRTIQNEIRIGYSRISVVLARIIVVLPLATLLYLFYSIPYTLMMGAANGFAGNFAAWEVFSRVILFFVQVIAVLSFSALIMFWCRKSSLSMMISVCFTVITCNILRGFLNDNAIFRVTSFYRIQMNSGAMTTQDILISFISATVTIVVVLLATFIVFRKAELK